MYSALWWLFWDEPWPAGSSIGALGLTTVTPVGHARDVEPVGGLRTVVHGGASRSVERA